MSSSPAGIPFFFPSLVLCHLCQMRVCTGAHPCHVGNGPQLRVKTPDPSSHSSSSRARHRLLFLAFTEQQCVRRNSGSSLHSALSIHLLLSADSLQSCLKHTLPLRVAHTHTLYPLAVTFHRGRGGAPSSVPGQWDLARSVFNKVLILMVSKLCLDRIFELRA